MEEENQDPPLEITNGPLGTPDGEGDNGNEEIKSGFSTLMAGLRKFLVETMSIKEGLDIEGSASSIKRDMVFKGHSVWILICSIFIASIGLNVGSTAVIIGAMLISPLMAPILGIGLAVGTNDLATLKTALKGFGVMIAISLITSTIFFFISPFKEATSEILARTEPTPFDVLIAVFGGLAGIIAGTQKEKSNVIPGVAIATALMPPLCTVGFGLATWSPSIIFNAGYLFLLNSVFISVSTVVAVRYLSFPNVQAINEVTERKVKRSIIFFVILVIVPSTWIFVDVIKKSLFQTRAESFIADNVKFDGTEIIRYKFNYNDTIKDIEMFAMGEILSPAVITNLKDRLKNYNLEDATLTLHQAKDDSDELTGKLKHEVREGIIEELLEKNIENIEDKNRYIRDLERQLYHLKKDSLPLEQLLQELQVQYPKVTDFAFAKMIKKSATDTDTIPTFMVSWDKGTALEEEQKLAAWLQVRFKFDTINVISTPTNE